MNILIIDPVREHVPETLELIRQTTDGSYHKISNGVSTISTKYDEVKEKGSFDVVLISIASVLEGKIFYTECWKCEAGLKEAIKIFILSEGLSSVLATKTNKHLARELKCLIDTHGGWFITKPFNLTEFWALMTEAEVALAQNKP
ncbi:MAG: hypothetical protein WCO10_01840 [bacterium]